MDALKGINLVVRFLVEICVLIAVIWGLLGSPKATFHLQGISLLLLEVIVFGSGVLALFLTKNNLLAWVLALTLILNRILLFVWTQ